MQPAAPEQKALTIARLLGQLSDRDITCADTQTWLCKELANLCSARSAALYWPAGEGLAFEFWGDLLEWGKDDDSGQAWVAATCQALRVGQLVWIEDNNPGGAPPGASPGRVACLPFPGKRQGAGALLLGEPEAIFNGEVQELLRTLGLCIASLRDQARQLHQSRQACIDLEKRRAELLHSRDTLRALFDNTPTSMYIVGADYRLLAVNRRRADIAGRKPQRLVGQRCYQALYGHQSPCPDCLVRDSLADGRNTRRVTKKAYSGGPAVILEITTFPVQEAPGEAGQAIVFEEDVTERRRLEASLAQSEKLAAIGQLAAGVAHEINNPLTAIIANAQLLQRSLPDQDEEWNEMASLILQAGMRASQVVQQLLDLSRQSRTGPLVTDVNENLRQAFSILGYEFKARSVRLEIELDEVMPVLWANPDQLQSVWLNLLVNAMDAVQDGQGEIRVGTRQSGEMVEVRVADNGIGIPAERLAHIFEPFYTTKEPGRGTGLGLSICQRVVKEHGGEISVQSQPGVGTCFEVLLPITSPS